MKVGILGTGDVGRALADGFLSRGHEVMMGSRSTGNEKLQAWLVAAEGKAQAGTFEDAAKHGELVVLASLGAANKEVLEAAGPANLAGKVLIDATNPLDYSQGMPPRMLEVPEGSLGAQVQALAPEAKVVKCWNTIGNPYMVEPVGFDAPPTMFMAGDHPEAKAKVKEILAAFGWEDTLDVGPIWASHYLEAMTMVWVAAFMQRGNGDHAFRLVRR